MSKKIKNKNDYDDINDEEIPHYIDEFTRLKKIMSDKKIQIENSYNNNKDEVFPHYMFMDEFTKCTKSLSPTTQKILDGFLHYIFIQNINNKSVNYIYDICVPTKYLTKKYNIPFEELNYIMNIFFHKISIHLKNKHNFSDTWMLGSCSCTKDITYVSFCPEFLIYYLYDNIKED